MIDGMGENFTLAPCDKNCKVKKVWTVKYPEVGEQLNLSAVLVCLSCIHFVVRDHFIPVVDRGYNK
jgi:hypothetical protein